MSTTPGGYRFQYPPGTNFQRYLAPASLAISAGDLLYWTGTVAQPLSSKALLASQVLDQAAVKPLFLGVAASGRIAAQNTSVWPTDYVEAIPNCLYLADCASATWEVGDLVGVVRNGGATALLDQQVVKVSSDNLAIGQVFRREPSAVTQVLVRLWGKGDPLGDFNRYGMAARQGTGVATLTDAAQTLDPSSNPMLNMVPTAARVITMPAEAQSAGLMFWITNSSGGAFNITCKASDGATAIKGNGVIPQNKTGILWCDGTNWNGSVSA
jgi:hypothetical protein